MTRSTSARGDVKVQPIKPAARAAAPRPASARARSFLSLADLTPRELDACLTLAARLKQVRASGRRRLETPLEGRHVADAAAVLGRQRPVAQSLVTLLRGKRSSLPCQVPESD